MPQISVIVPVYKGEKYLPACIDSILQQSFSDFELILIDDGSPDSSGAICDGYAKEDGRVRVILQENAGASSARNKGVDQANGKYIAFVDSDDIAHPQMLEIMYRVLSDSIYPMVHCSFHRFEQNSTPTFELYDLTSSIAYEEITSASGMLKMMDSNSYGHYIWKGLYLKDYISRFKFPGYVCWEDIIWSGEVVGNLSRYCFIPLDLYGYRMNQNSLVNRWDWNTQKQYFSALLSYYSLSVKYTPSVAERVKEEVYQAIIVGENSLYQRGVLNEKASKEIALAAKKCRPDFLSVFRSDISFKRKLVFLLCAISFPFGCSVRRVLIR